MTTETTAPMTGHQIKQRLDEMTGWPSDGTPVTSASVLARSLAVAAQLRWSRSMSGYFDLGDERFAESIQVMCAKFGLLHLLMDLMARDPAKADELATEICGMWDDGGEVGTTLWEHCQSLGIDADEVNRLEEAWQATPGAEAARKPQDPSAAELAAARRAVRTLSGITGRNMQAMEAARIEMRQTGPQSAMQWIVNSLPEFWEDPDTAWDGTESAQAWFDRTRDAYRMPGDAPQAPHGPSLAAALDIALTALRKLASGSRVVATAETETDARMEVAARAIAGIEAAREGR